MTCYKDVFDCAQVATPAMTLDVIRMPTVSLNETPTNASAVLASREQANDVEVIIMERHGFHFDSLFYLRFSLEHCLTTRAASMTPIGLPLSVSSITILQMS